MDIVTQGLDPLSLDLTKEHLYVDFPNDDVLITQYINASLKATELYLNRSILDISYINTTEELVQVQGYYKLRLPYIPETVTMTINTVSITIFKDQYTYDAGNSMLYIMGVDESVDNVTEIAVTVSTTSDTNTINQARLLMVANFYAFREASSNLNLKEVPMGAKFILDLMEASVW